MSDLKVNVKRLLANALYRSGLFRKSLKKIGESRALTLMYHRIIPCCERGSFLQPGMFVDPETFEMHLRFLKKHFCMQAVSDVYLATTDKTGRDQCKPSCSLTFDDGWSDFYDYAFPSLVKHNIPATVFLPTRFIGNEKRFWSERLRQICSQLSASGNFQAFRDFFLQLLSLRDNEKSLPNDAFYEVVLNSLKRFREEKIDEIINELIDRFAITLPLEHCDFLSWGQIEKMHGTGLITFGSHTETHRIMTTLDKNEIHTELALSMQSLIDRLVVEKKNIPFCYPNGDFNETIIEATKALGYACAFTTRSGWNNKGAQLFDLRRVGIHQDISYTKELLAYRIYSTLA